MLLNKFKLSYIFVLSINEEMKKHKLHSTVVNQCLCCSGCSILQCLQHQVTSALKMDDMSQTQLQSPAARLHCSRNEGKLQLVDTLQQDSAICYQIVKYFRWPDLQYSNAGGCMQIHQNIELSITLSSAVFLTFHSEQKFYQAQLMTHEVHSEN